GCCPAGARAGSGVHRCPPQECPSLFPDPSSQPPEPLRCAPFMSEFEWVNHGVELDAFLPSLRSLQAPTWPRPWQPCLARQNDFHEVRLTSGAQRGLASSRPEPHVLSGTHERGGQPWTSLARRCSSVSTFTRTRSPWRTRR